MKKITLFLTSLLFCTLLWAQAPQGISHQAVIRNSLNEVVTNSTIGIRVSILQGSESGTVVYRETHTPVSNINGLITYIIGQGVVEIGEFDTIDWSNEPYFLQTEADPAGGTSYTITGTTQLLSVPYALYTQKADTVMNEADPVYTGSQAVHITGTDITNLGNLSGTNTGNQSLIIDGHMLTISGGNTVQIPDSVNDADADPANELQELSLDGDQLSLSKGGGTVQLPADSSTAGEYYYADKDSDGFGFMYESTWVPNGITPPAFYVNNSDDCNDNDYYTQDGSAEICDGVDNDCDGQIDELWPELGEYCTSGEGICLRVGGYICDESNPAGPAVCSAEAGEPAVSESCNYLDDDCFGDIDEDFVNGDGKYYTIANCGYCGCNCGAIYNLTPNAYGVCNSSGFWPVCEMMCDPGYYDLDGIPQNGCEFHLQEEVVYVSPDGEDVPGCGTSIIGGTINACRTINYGLDEAVSHVKQGVLVANSFYNETVYLHTGIDLLGGYDPVTWNRNTENSSTTISGTDSISHHPVTILASSIGAAELSGFIIYGKDAVVSGYNSYAVYISNPGAGFILSENTIYGGCGSDGDNGLDGTDGQDGDDGNNGLNTVESTSYTYSFNVSGGSGGSLSLGTTTLYGGNGGGVHGQLSLNSVQESGTNGGATKVSGGSGGSGGYDRNSSDCSSFNTGGHLAEGISGNDGLAGADGSGGPGATNATGSVVSSHWQGQNGSDGQDGDHGSGGGGGGSGGGANVTTNCVGTDDCSGGTGGGGGSGAEGGHPGTGGDPGGSSFCIFIVNGAAPAISDNLFYPGHAGDGGNGGFGGMNGFGGTGGTGGQISGPWSFVLGTGGNGGDGGNSGHGGGGGGATGGSSFGIYTSGVTGSPSYETTGNSFTGGNAGSGGKGGKSYGNAGGVGTDGSILNTSYH